VVFGAVGVGADAEAVADLVEELHGDALRSGLAGARRPIVRPKPALSRGLHRSGPGRRGRASARGASLLGIARAARVLAISLFLLPARRDSQQKSTDVAAAQQAGWWKWLVRKRKWRVCRGRKAFQEGEEFR